METGAAGTHGTYRTRRARHSPLYRLAEEHYETLQQVHDPRFAKRCGFLRAEVCPAAPGALCGTSTGPA